jgi:hypothetical protein
VTEAKNTGLLRTIDSAARDRVLVYGSLPPAGRDLDLLVRPTDASALAAGLGAAGFRSWQRAWVRFFECDASVVELIPAASLHLPSVELDGLFADGSPLVGSEKIVEPAPHHTLLILARRLAHERRLAPKHKARIERAVERDPAAWERALERAPAWMAETALQRLRALYSSGRAPWSFRWRSFVRRPRRTRVVALSGPDAERKRLHAQALRATFDRLGVSAHLGTPRSIWPPVSAKDTSKPIGKASATLRALQASLRLWWPVWRRVGRGGVVIYEASAVDVAVSLSVRLAKGESPRLAWLPLRLGPSSLCSFLFEPDSAEAATQRQREAYQAAARALGARLIPPGLETKDVCVVIATGVFDALSRSPNFPFRRRLRPARQRL